MLKNFYDELMKELINRRIISEYEGWEEYEEFYSIKHFDLYGFAIHVTDSTGCVDAIRFYDWNYRLVTEIQSDEHYEYYGDTCNYIDFDDHYVVVGNAWFNDDNTVLYMNDDHVNMLIERHDDLRGTQYYYAEYRNTIKELTEDEFISYFSKGFVGIDVEDIRSCGMEPFDDINISWTNQIHDYGFRK